MELEKLELLPSFKMTSFSLCFDSISELQTLKTVTGEMHSESVWIYISFTVGPSHD